MHVRTPVRARVCTYVFTLPALPPRSPVAFVCNGRPTLRLSSAVCRVSAKINSRLNRSCIALMLSLKILYCIYIRLWEIWRRLEPPVCRPRDLVRPSVRVSV